MTVSDHLPSHPTEDGRGIDSCSPMLGLISVYTDCLLADWLPIRISYSYCGFSRSSTGEVTVNKTDTLFKRSSQEEVNKTDTLFKRSSQEERV